jgi:hypothetical protein
MHMPNLAGEKIQLELFLFIESRANFVISSPDQWTKIVHVLYPGCGNCWLLVRFDLRMFQF